MPPERKPPTVPDRVKGARENRDMTRRELATLCRLSPSTIAQIEQGTLQLSVDVAIRIARATGMSPAIFLGGLDPCNTLAWCPTCKVDWKTRDQIDRLKATIKKQRQEIIRLTGDPIADLRGTRDRDGLSIIRPRRVKPHRNGNGKP